MREIKVLITAPELTKQGGVADYYKSIIRKFSLKPKLFIVGKRTNENGTPYFRLFKDFLIFTKTLISDKIDLVHINPSFNKKSILRESIFIIISKILRKKVLVFFRGWDKEFETKIKNNYSRIFKIIYNRADSIIVLATDFKIKLLDWGVSKPIYVETTKVDDELLKNFNLAYKKRAKKITILYLGRFELEKGILIVLEVYKELKKEFPDISLTMAGNGTHFEEIKELIHKERISDIYLPGYISGKRKYEVFCESDIFLFPSYYGEGMPNSVLEAMAFGLAVITRPVGGIIDFFEDSRMGFIDDSKDPKMFIDATRKLIIDKDKLGNISLYNYRYAKKKFYASQVVRRLEKIYEDTINGIS